MRAKTTTTLALALLIGAAVSLLSGCNQLTVRTTVAADGGGTRRTELRIESSEDVPAVLELFGGGAGGWQEVPGGEEGARVFRRESRIAQLEDWPREDGPVLRGDAAGGAGEIRLDRIDSVTMVRAADGVTYEFRERLAWRGMKERIANIYAASFAGRLAAVYPGLDRTALAELRGLAAGHLAMGWDTFLREGDFDFEQEALLSSLAAMTVDLFARAGVRADAVAVAAAARAAMVEQGQADEDPVVAEMPWVDALVGTSLTIELRMPGTVLESNSERTSGDTAVWEVDLAEAIRAPVELRARSVAAGR